MDGLATQAGMFAGGLHAAAAYRAEVLADSPTAYWRLGEASGTTAEDETGSYDGTYVASPMLGATGIFAGNSSVDFNGSTQYVTAPAPINSLTGSIEIWVKTTGAAIYDIIGRQNAGTTGLAFIEANRDQSAALAVGKIVFLIRNDAGTLLHRIATSSSVGVSDGSWHQIVVTFASGSAAKIYFDGAEVATTVDPGNSATVPSGTLTLANLFIGGRDLNGSLTLPFDGTIDEVAIYPTSLSAARIAAHYAAAGY